MRKGGIEWGFLVCVAGIFLFVMALLWLLTGEAAAAQHSPESCGRMVVKRAERAAREGWRFIQYPGMRQCPFLRVPEGYQIERLDLGQFAIYREDGTRLMRVVPRRKPPPPKDGVYGNEVWQNGRFAGKVVVHE